MLPVPRVFRSPGCRLKVWQSECLLAAAPISLAAVAETAILRPAQARVRAQECGVDRARGHWKCRIGSYL